MKNNRYPLLALKGIAMGAADVIPGVSGGTIAFITGIYQELLQSIKSIDIQALKMLLTGKAVPFWHKINGNFLLAVAAGIALSIFSLARLMTWLLAQHPIPVWSFFFGLIIASSFLVSRDITKWNAATVLGALAGAAAAYAITALSPASTPDVWWFIILCGAVAICAMILPGISGSFILLLMGKYQYIMTAVSELNINVILLFGLGAAIGIIGFSHLLTWLLRHRHNLTIAVLTGFMVGSLNKIWPWKATLTTRAEGLENSVRESNILPGRFAEVGIDPQLGRAILFCVIGILLIITLEAINKRLAKRKTAAG